jgi:uncharacterized coiled-coil protein SlyX
MPNRVEELESAVSNLQAAVDGLTEELVETRARLSDVEEELAAAKAAREAATEQEPVAAPGTEPVTPAKGDVGVEAEATVEGAAPGPGGADEAPPAEDAERADDGAEEANTEGDEAAEEESGSGSDIIVA